MGRTAPRRKAAPTVFKQIEGISSEEEGEASAPENEEELLASGDDSEELVVSEDEASQDIIVESFDEEHAMPKAKAKTGKDEKRKASDKSSSEGSDEDVPVDVPVVSKIASKTSKAKAPKAKIRSKAKAAPKVAKAVVQADESSSEDSEDSEMHPAPKKKGTSSKPEDEGSSNDGSEENTAGKRHFKIQTDTIEPSIELDKLSSGGGRFGGSTPMQAAKKAFTQICRAVETNEDDCEYIFTITETTRGSQGKDFTYIGTRKRRTSPQKVVKRGDAGATTFNINYEHQVKSYKPGKKSGKTTKDVSSPSVTKERTPKSSGAKTAKSKAAKAKALSNETSKGASNPDVTLESQVVDTHRRSKKARAQQPPEATESVKKVTAKKSTKSKPVSKKSKATKK